jgi:hypothetical protein
MMRQVDVHVRSAVEAGVVVVAGGAVDVRAERARRGVGDGVLEMRRCRARHEVEEGLVVAVIAEGQAMISPLLSSAWRSPVSVWRSVWSDSTLMASLRSPPQPEVHAGDCVHRDGDVLLHVLLNPARATHGVVPGIRLTKR